jgi:hypothetical protein
MYGQGISRNLLFIEGEKLWADAKIAFLLFHGKQEGMYRFLDMSALPMGVFEWLRREGEEFYFYKTTDEFITYVGQLTNHYLKGTDKNGYILCPIDVGSVKTVSRDLYKSIIDNQMMVIDIDGNKQDIIFDKNIIHFKLMGKDEAAAIYRKLVQGGKNQFPRLQEWIEHEF